MKIFLTGGSGFVGTEVAAQLIARGDDIHALVNGKALELGERVKSFPGGLFDVTAIHRAMTGCDAIIHLVGIIHEQRGKGVTFERIHVEGTRNVVEAAGRLGLKRYVHMSALGSRAGAVSRYHQTKFQAEELVRASGLDWTIIRPSMIHGPLGDFMRMEADWAKKKKPPYLFMPYFGAGLLGRGGAGKLQPVDVRDVARAFVEAISNVKTVRQIYEMGGGQQVTWPQLHQISAQLITGKKRWTMPVPAWYAKAIAKVLPAAVLPFNRDQVVMSQEDNVCDMAHFRNDFGWMPGRFEEQLAEYAGQM